MPIFKRKIKNVKAPPPETKSMLLKKSKEGLQENIRIVMAIINHRKELVAKKAPLLEKARLAVEKAKHDYEVLAAAIKIAPTEIEALERQLIQMRKNLKNVHLTPKLDKINQLKAKIAQLQQELGE